MSTSNNAAPDLSRLAKILTRAGHPRTPDTEAKAALENLCRLAGVQDTEDDAVQAMRALYVLLDRAELTFDNLVTPKVVLIEVPVYPTASSLVRRTEEAEREAKDLKRQLAIAQKKLDQRKTELQEERRTSRNLRAQVKDIERLVRENEVLEAKLREATGIDQDLPIKPKKSEPVSVAAPLSSPSAEDITNLMALFNNFGEKKPQPVNTSAALQQQMQRSIAPTLEMFKKKAAPKSDEVQRPETTSALNATGIEGLIASLSVLANKLGSDARLKTVLAYLHAANRDGITIKELSGLIQGVSENSLRYSLRSLGQGWPDKQRPGLRVVADCAASDGGRARAFVATSHGRAVLDQVLAALDFTGQRRDVKPEMSFAA